jgi:four helix bundle protein
VGSKFRDLIAYRLATELAAELHAPVASWPKLERYVIGWQLLRSAHSVGANIAEATGRWHLNDRGRFFLIARGSLYETEHWLLTAENQGLLPRGSSTRVEEIARVLNGLISKERLRS